MAWQFFEGGYKGSSVTIEEFKAVVPDAMGPQEWYRYWARTGHTFKDGSPIVKA